MGQLKIKTHVAVTEKFTFMTSKCIPGKSGYLV